MDQLGTSAVPVGNREQSHLETIFNELCERRDRLQRQVSEAEAIVSRTFGDDSPPDKDQPREVATGSLGQVNGMLGQINELLSRLEVAVNRLSQLG